MHRLADVQLLRGIDDERLRHVQDAGEIVTVAEGERIIEEGAVPQNLVVLITGKLEVFVPDPANPSRGNRLATINPGDSCGEYGFIDRRPASASVKAVEKSEVFVIANEDFDALMRADHELERMVYRNLLKTLVNRLRASNVVIDVLRSPQ